MDTNNILKRLRNNKDMSRRELSDATGVSIDTIINIEIGRFIPSLETLNKLSKFFDVSIDYLVGKDDKVNEHKRELLEIIKRMPDDKLDATIKMINKIMKE